MLNATERVTEKKNYTNYGCRVEKGPQQVENTCQLMSRMKQEQSEGQQQEKILRAFLSKVQHIL